MNAKITGLACVAGTLLLAGSMQARAAGSCDRACLEGFVDRYFDALLAHDPKKLPMAPNVRYTEDGQHLRIGDGLWRTMHAKGHYRLFVTDVPAGQVAFFGTIEEDNRDPTKGTPVLMALRLKVREGKVSEIEEITVRDEKAAQKVDAMKVDPIYLATVPAGERASRASMIATADKYFTGMQQNDGKGDYPFADDCNRIENGGQSTNVPTPAGQTRPDPKTATNYSAQWSCMEQFKSGLLHFVSRIRDRRYVAVDEERGIVFAFGFFDHEGGDTRHFTTPDGRQVVAGPVQPWTWEIAELFKVQGGKIHRIQAVLQRSPYGMNSGWSTWEQGLSDKARDVTMK
ncbi:MAG TPA: nuclear transport factor 2 family protein [Steroidobacteraceae bacterium]|nr:nuclear transport factor 2 family protein [Steroidobacteraceae bacterium]